MGWQFLQRKRGAVLANIETEPYGRMTFDANIYGTGTVKPYQSAVLTWSASSIVSEVNVNLGESVQKDQLLMALEQIPFR